MRLHPLTYAIELFFTSSHPCPFSFPFFPIFLLLMRQLEESGSALMIRLCLSKGGVVPP